MIIVFISVSFNWYQLIDVDYSGDLVSTFNIKSVPTFVRFDNGIETGRIVGSQNRESLEKFINEVA